VAAAAAVFAAVTTLLRHSVWHGIEKLSRCKE
jgi:hypothetical protein